MFVVFGAVSLLCVHAAGLVVTPSLAAMGDAMYELTHATPALRTGNPNQSDGLKYPMLNIPLTRLADHIG